MTYFFITLPFIVMAWILYTSKNVLLCVGRWFLSCRYQIESSGDIAFGQNKSYLIMPNHPAIVDPIILVSELHRRGLSLCPLVDESFFSNGFVRHVLALFNSVRVPDFRRANFRPFLKVRPTYKASLKRAKALSYSVLALLTAGENVLLYPSGHITADGRESLENRQLAFNVISQLPKGVEVIGVRIRGLFGSTWSRAGGVPPPPFVKTLVKSVLTWPFSVFRRRRSVSIYAENMTAKVIEWSKLPRAGFNRMLEQWYNADLEMKGLDKEPAT